MGEQTLEFELLTCINMLNKKKQKKLKLPFWWSASITLDNNNDVLTESSPFFLNLYFTTYLSWSEYLYFYCFFNLNYYDPFDHYTACCIPLNDSLASEHIYHQ